MIYWKQYEEQSQKTDLGQGEQFRVLKNQEQKNPDAEEHQKGENWDCPVTDQNQLLVDNCSPRRQPGVNKHFVQI